METIEASFNQAQQNNFLSSTAIATFSTKFNDSLSLINKASRYNTDNIINRVVKGLAFISHLVKKCSIYFKNHLHVYLNCQSKIHQIKERENNKEI